MGEAGPLGKFATALGLVFQTFKEGAGGVLTKVEDALKGVGNFFKGLAELSGLSDLARITGEGLSKALKAIPVIGAFLLAIEGIFAFFDTETLQKTFDTQVIGFKERLSGMVGEIFGSLFGLLDLGAQLINWAFGIDLRSAKTENGESYEERVTSVFSRMINDILSWFGNFGMLIGGILKLDGPQVKNAVEEMSLIVDDWLTAIRNALAGIADAILEKIPGVDFRFGQRVSRRDANKNSQSDAETKRLLNKAMPENQSDAESKRLQGSKGAEPTKPPSTGKGASSKGMGLTPNAEYAIRFFEAQGYTTAQAAGIVANLQAESGANLKIDAVGDGGKAYGIAQWHPDRQENFRKVFGKDIRASSLQEQLQFIVWELNNTEKKAGAKVRAAQSEVETAMLFDQYYERSSGEHRQKRMATAQTLYAALGGGLGGASAMYDFGYGKETPESMQARKAPESINVLAKNSEDQLAILARQEGLTKEQLQTALAYYKSQSQANDETKRYREERARLEDRFYGTLENNFKNMLTNLAGGPGAGTAEGGARRFVEGRLGKGIGKISQSIFGKEMGGEMGQIFTQLAGSYGDQFATQVLGPALFGGNTQQANRFFNSMASGNKKAAREDLLFGITGGKARTGIRSALGYEEGIAQTARDLATVVGGPFGKLFQMDGAQPLSQEQKQAQLVSDPIVRAQYDSAQLIVEAMQQGQSFDKNRWEQAKRMSMTGGGTSSRTGAGNMFMNLVTGGGQSGAMGRLADTGFNLLNYGITSKIAGDNPFAQALVGGIVGDFTTAARTGGNFDLMQAAGRAFGINVGPGASFMDLFNAGSAVMNNPMAMMGNYLASGISSMATASGATYGTGFMSQQSMQLAAQEAGMSAATGSTAASIGSAAAVVGNAVLAYTISKSLSGGYSAGKWVDYAAAIGSYFIGPIAGVIGGIVNRAFGRKAPALMTQGIQGTLGEDVTDLQQYATYMAKGGWFRSDKWWTEYYAMDPEAEIGLRNAARDLTMTIRKAGYQIGLGTIDLTNAVKSTSFSLKKQVTEMKYGNIGYDAAYQQYGFQDQTNYDGGTYRQELFPYGTPFTMTREYATLKNQEISDADRKIIDGLQEGVIGKLSDGTLVRLKKGSVTRGGSSYSWLTGVTTPGPVQSAQVEIISGMNAAYGVAFKQMQEMFSLAVNQSSLDMESLMKQYGNAFIKNSFGPLLDRFIRPGEQLYETFDRLTSATVDFNETMIKLRYGVEDFFSTLSGDMFAMAEQKDIFMELYGGRQKFLEATTQYFDLFYSQSEKLEYYAEVGRKQMDLALYEANLRGQYTVDSLLGNIGTDFEAARLNYRRIVDQFVEDNKDLLSANDPEAIKRLAVLQGDLAASYYTAAQSIQELNRVGGGSVNKENIIAAAKAIFEADKNQFALGGIAQGPVTGYGATLHGVEAVVPLPNGKEIPVKLSSVAGDVGSTTVVNNIVGNGNAAVNSTPTNVFTSPPSAVSSSAPNRVLSSAY
jgi:hypothetical protein